MLRTQNKDLTLVITFESSKYQTLWLTLCVSAAATSKDSRNWLWSSQVADKKCILCSSPKIKIDWKKHFFLNIVFLERFFQKDLSFELDICLNRCKNSITFAMQCFLLPLNGRNVKKSECLNIWLFNCEESKKKINKVVSAVLS